MTAQDQSRRSASAPKPGSARRPAPAVPAAPAASQPGGAPPRAPRPRAAVRRPGRTPAPGDGLVSAESARGLDEAAAAPSSASQAPVLSEIRGPAGEPFRAVVPMKAEEHSLQVDLEGYGWIYPDQCSPEALRARARILSDIPDGEREVAVANARWVLFDADNGVWGVTSIVARVAYFRLEHFDPALVQKSVERLVDELEPGPFGHGRQIVRPFIPIKLAREHRRVFEGWLQPRPSVGQTIKVQKREFLTALVSLLAALVLFLLTSPMFMTPVAAMGPLPADEATQLLFVQGNAERLSSAAFVTAAVSALAVVLSFLETRRQPRILWRPVSVLTQ